MINQNNESSTRVSAKGPTPENLAIFERAVGYAQAGQKELANKDFKLLRSADPDNVDLILWVAETEKETSNVKTYLMRAEYLAGKDDPRIIEAWKKYNIQVKEPWLKLRPGTGLAIGFLIAFILAPVASFFIGRQLAGAIGMLVTSFFWYQDPKPRSIFRYGVGAFNFLLLYNLMR